MARRQQIDVIYAGSVGEIFAALGSALAFRRWTRAKGTTMDPVPVSGCRYHCRFGSVLRTGRVVEIIRPVAITLKEILHDSPCRVSLTMRWRIDPGLAGCTVRLRAHYRLNHAAVLRARHWDRRLAHHFRNQFTFLGVHLGRIRDGAGTSRCCPEKRDLTHH